MGYAAVLLVLVWLALAAYAVLAGADFGAGILDLVAGRGADGRARRELITHVVGPVWEANHVWLIFVLVLLWSGFPGVFAAIASTLYIPLTVVAFGIIGRGAAFAFRKAATTPGLHRLFGLVFAGSSLLTPFFLGAVAGAIASGRVPPGVAAGDVLGSWVNPTGLFTGALAVAACAYLAAVYLCEDARRTGRPGLAEHFRRRALTAGVGTGALSLVGLAVAASDAPALAYGLVHGGLPWTAGAVIAGTAGLVLLARRHYLAARVTGAAAVAAVLFGWGAARYPELLPGLSVAAAQAPEATLRAMLLVSAVGLILLAPSLFALFRLFQRRT